MHLFVSEEEFAELKDNAEALAERADDYIRRLNRQVDNEKARAEAAQINAEQTCSLIEQKYLAVAGENASMEKEKAELVGVSEQRAAELVEAKAEVHRLQLNAIKHGSDLEREQLQVSELHAARRELLDLIERKNTELEEKNSAAASYLAKIVSLTNERSKLEAKLHEERAERTRCQTLQARVEQEKELLQQHNKWLRDELASKNTIAQEERHRAAEVEADLRAKLGEAAKDAKEKGDTASKLEGRVRELQTELERVRQDFRDVKHESILQGEQFEMELSSAMKLVELYKESSEEWCGKANELEGVVKALETHIKQKEDDFEGKLRKQVQEAETYAKEAEAIRLKLEADLVEAREAVKRQEPFLPSSGTSEGGGNLLVVRRAGNEDAAVAGSEPPRLVGEFSSTALAAMLLRDGWSLAKTYGRMVEVEDAWRHEKQKRMEAEQCLEMILYQIEEKAGAIREERAEQQRLHRAYIALQAKLEDSAVTRERLEHELREYKAELDVRERESKAAGKLVEELQMQNVHLFKEIEVLQKVAEGVSRGDLRAAQALGIAWTNEHNVAIAPASHETSPGHPVEVSNVRELVEQNSQLRLMCTKLAQENELKEAEMKELRKLQLAVDQQEKQMEETNRRLLESAETAQKMQESAAMFKRLYEEEAHVRRHALEGGSGELLLIPRDAYQGDGEDYRKLLEETKAELQKLREDTKEQNAMTKSDFDKAREEASSARIDRAKAELEAQHYKEQLDLIRSEARDLRRDLDGAIRRSFEYSSMITSYQCKLREAQEAVHAAEEKERQSSFEVSVLEREKALLSDAEKKASQELSALSDKLHRLQASFDNIQQTLEAREATRAEERKRLEDELHRLQLEWADGRRELEFERTRVRELTVARDKVTAEAASRVDLAMKAAEEAKAKEMEAETRARLAQARCEELEASLKKSEDKVTLALTGGTATTTGPPDSGLVDRETELMAALMQGRREIEIAKEEAAAEKEHAKQWKIIAERNEEAMKLSDDRHQTYKEEALKAKEAREAEISSLRTRLAEVQTRGLETTSNFNKTMEEKNAALQAAIEEHSKLKETNAKISRDLLETQQRLEVLQKDSEDYHGRWREEHANFERQVILQAATIEELKLTSAKLEKVGAECEEWHARAQKAEAELASLRVQWEAEVSALQSEKENMLKKTAELESQNQLLLDRTEAMHIMAAEDVRKQAGDIFEKGVEKEAREVSTEDGLQEVVRYLRRSKQAGDTELSLLKQERSRLQKQLEGVNHALNDAHTRIRDYELKASAHVHTDDEFAKLQGKIEQMALLEQSNRLLRAENQQNLRASEDWRRKAESLQKEIEPIRAKLLEKEIEVDACRPEMTRLEDEAKRWHRRVNELLEKYRTVDLEEHQRVKEELANVRTELGKAQFELTSAQETAAEARAALESTRSEAGAATVQKEKKISELTKELGKSKALIESTERRIAELTTEVKKLKEAGEENERKSAEEILKGRQQYTIIKKKTLEYEKSIATLTKETASIAAERDSWMKEKEVLEAARGSWEAERSSLAKELEKAKLQAKTAEEGRQKAAAAAAAAALKAPVPPAQKAIPAQAVKKGLAEAQAAKRAAAEMARKQSDNTLTSIKNHKRVLFDVAQRAKERGEVLYQKLELWNKEFAEWKSTKNKDEVEIPKELLTEQQLKEETDAYRSLLEETERISQHDFTMYAEVMPDAPAPAPSEAIPSAAVAVQEATKQQPAPVGTQQTSEGEQTQPLSGAPVVPALSTAIIARPPLLPPILPSFPGPLLPPPASAGLLGSRPPSAASSVSIPTGPGGATAAVKLHEPRVIAASTAEEIKSSSRLPDAGAQEQTANNVPEVLTNSIADLKAKIAFAECVQEKKRARKINRDPVDVNMEAPGPEALLPGPSTSTGDAPQVAAPSGPSAPLQPSLNAAAAPTSSMEADVAAGKLSQPEGANMLVSSSDPTVAAEEQLLESKSEPARLLKRPHASISEEAGVFELGEGAEAPGMHFEAAGTIVSAGRNLPVDAAALPSSSVADTGPLKPEDIGGFEIADPSSKRPKLSTPGREGTPPPLVPEQMSEPVTEEEIIQSGHADKIEAIMEEAPLEAVTEVIGGEIGTGDIGEEVLSPAPADMGMLTPGGDSAGQDLMDTEAGEMAPVNLPIMVPFAGVDTKPVLDINPTQIDLNAEPIGSWRDGQSMQSDQLTAVPLAAPLIANSAAAPVDNSEAAGGEVTVPSLGGLVDDVPFEPTLGIEKEGASSGATTAIETNEALAVLGEGITRTTSPLPEDETLHGTDATPIAAAPRIITLGGEELEKRRQARMQGLTQAEVAGRPRVTRSQALPPNPLRSSSEERPTKKLKGRGTTGRGRGDAAAAGASISPHSKVAQKSRGRGAGPLPKDLLKEGDSEGLPNEGSKAPTSPTKTSNPYEALAEDES